MARIREWVGYANLAAIVLQAAEPGGINNKMGQLAELRLQKECRERRVPAAPERGDVLRNSAFAFGGQLRGREEVAGQNLVKACLRTGQFGRLSFPTAYSGGNRLSVVTLSTRASARSSSSVTQRSCASIWERVPREMSNPFNWHSAASFSCVRPSSERRRRICGPTMFAGVLVLAMPQKSGLTVILGRDHRCYAFLAPFATGGDSAENRAGSRSAEGQHPG